MSVKAELALPCELTPLACDIIWHPWVSSDCVTLEANLGLVV